MNDQDMDLPFEIAKLLPRGVFMKFLLPDLPFELDALEPFMSRKTLEYHYGKHHKNYVDKLNENLKGTEFKNSTLEEVMLFSVEQPKIFNNAAQAWNHSFFWMSLAPNAGGQPTGALEEAISAAFGSFDAFKEKFAAAGMTRFGSGWAWLIYKEGKLEISSTPNQDNPLMDVAEFKGTPVLGCDVWEHAYYLKYQNKRADYLTAFWNLVNWVKVAERFEKATK